MSETYIPVENLRIKIPNYIEESSEEPSKESLDNQKMIDEEKDNKLLSFLYKFITCLCKIRIPRFFTIYKIF
jgi:hypothetical protein